MTFYTFTTTIFATSTREKVCGGVKNVYPKHHEALPGPSLLNRDQMWELEEGVTFGFHYVYIYIYYYIHYIIYIYTFFYIFLLQYADALIIFLLRSRSIEVQPSSRHRAHNETTNHHLVKHSSNTFLVITWSRWYEVNWWSDHEAQTEETKLAWAKTAQRQFLQPTCQLNSVSVGGTIAILTSFAASQT